MPVPPYPVTPNYELPLFPDGFRPWGSDLRAAFEKIDLLLDATLRTDLQDPTKGGALVATRLAFAGAVQRTGADRAADWAALEDFGAVGNDPEKDTLALQKALDSGAGVVYGRPGRTYVIDYAGTIEMLGDYHRYCLKIPSGVVLDGRGCTFRLANGANAAMLLNAQAGVTQASDIGIRNLVLDGNSANQTIPATGEMGCLTLYDVARLDLFNIRVLNPRQYAGRLRKIDGAFLQNLWAKGGYGDAWALGIAGTGDQHIVRAFIDQVFAEAFSGTYAGLQGNGAILTAKDTLVGRISTLNCAGGLKVQSDTTDVQIAELIFRGGPLGTANSGVKVQGSAGYIVERVSIGKICSIGAYGEGLHVTGVNGLQLGTYFGHGNNVGGATARDCDLRGANVDIDNLIVSNPAGGANTGVVINTDGLNTTSYRVKSATILNPNGRALQISTTEAGATVDIETLTAIDSRGGSAALTGVLWNTSASATVRCGMARTNLEATAAQPRISSVFGNYRFWLGRFESGAVPSLTSGVATLTSGAGSTTVSNPSVFRSYVGGASDYLQPIIDLVPWNSGAAGLGQMRAVPVDVGASNGFTIYHATAGANQRVHWRVAGWEVVPYPSA